MNTFTQGTISLPFIFAFLQYSSLTILVMRWRFGSLRGGNLRRARHWLFNQVKRILRVPWALRTNAGPFCVLPLNTIVYWYRKILKSCLVTEKTAGMALERERERIWRERQTPKPPAAPPDYAPAFSLRLKVRRRHPSSAAENTTIISAFRRITSRCVPDNETLKPPRHI